MGDERPRLPPRGRAAAAALAPRAPRAHRQRGLAARGRARARRRAVRAAAVRGAGGVRAEQAGRPHADAGRSPDGWRAPASPRTRCTPDSWRPRSSARAAASRALAASAYSKLRARKPAAGADTVVYLAASPDVEGRSGLFWADRQERRCRFRDEAQEEALGRCAGRWPRPRSARLARPWRQAALQRRPRADVDVRAARGEHRRRRQRRSREAARRGAEIVCLPELYRSPYFCQTRGPRELRARRAGAGAEHRGPRAPRRKKAARRGRGADLRAAGAGRLPQQRRRSSTRTARVAGLYRKMHIPDDPLFYEKFYFTPGDLGFQRLRRRAPAASAR